MEGLGTVFSNVSDFYHDIMNNKSDPRVQDWFLVREPWPVLALVFAYLYIVKKGPSWMKHRQAWDLKPVLIVYNFFIVALSAYMCWEFFATSVLRPRSEFSLICAKIEYTDHPESIRLARACWLYFISKIIELMDTMFFILRKKNNQLTFLHVYHHSSILFFWWSGAKFVPGGEAWFSCMYNCFIHVLMYSYYCVAAMGPNYAKYIWWKKYMTRMQLIQFVAIMVKTTHTIHVDCGFPRFYQVLQIAYAISQFVLFTNFYFHTYRPKQKALKENGRSSSERLTSLTNGVSNGQKHQHLD